jgi:hypothetical protein
MEGRGSALRRRVLTVRNAGNVDCSPAGVPQASVVVPQLAVNAGNLASRGRTTRSSRERNGRPPRGAVITRDHRHALANRQA